jgi:hypothetical protein
MLLSSTVDVQLIPPSLTTSHSGTRLSLARCPLQLPNEYPAWPVVVRVGSILSAQLRSEIGALQSVS